MELNTSDKKVIAQLEAMTLIQARRELASNTFGKPGSGNHSFASSWISIKESEERDTRESKTLAIAEEANSIAKSMRREVRKDRIIAIVAIIIAIIAARADIMLFISWFVSMLKNP